MGRKGGKRDSFKPKKLTQNYETAATDDIMDDEIDAFHKQRDVVPLNVNEDMVESDNDTEQPVFDFEEADEDFEDDEIENDSQLTGLAAKIARQQKYLLAKTGGVEDEMHDDAEDVEEKKAVWGRGKRIYYDADNIDYELQSSDEELPAEEEAEVLRLQKEKAKYLSMEDFGLEDVSQDASDGEPTVEEILSKGKRTLKASTSKETQDDIYPAYEEVKKDLEAFSKDEQMDVVYSSAPELVGLLSELNDALEQLENKVNPFLCKVREEKNKTNRGMHYMEVKQLLLLAYCQAITFYLLLKSEGRPVRDHPVIARLVEIKNLLAKMNQLDENLPSGVEEILNRKGDTETAGRFFRENDILESDSFTIELEPFCVSTETRDTTMPWEATELVRRNLRKDYDNKGLKCKHENDQVGLQSMEMLKVRAALEEKLKLKGISCSIALKSDKVQKHLKPVINGQLETFDDFDDDTVVIEGGIHGKNNELSGSLHPSKISQLLTPQLNKPKVVSGDDDLPKRDDIGERRRKHELRVLAGAGINSVDYVEDGSEDEFYKQAKAERTAKLAAKAGMYSRISAGPYLPEIPIDGKRQITNQMEKNRGLTRARKKLTKNPRKKYKLKHQKAVVRRKGQVREIRRPSSSYGGEETGINSGISRSIRFKN